MQNFPPGLAHLELHVGRCQLVADLRCSIAELFRDPPHSRVKAKTCFDTHDKQVKRIGQL